MWNKRDNIRWFSLSYSQILYFFWVVHWCSYLAVVAVGKISSGYHTRLSSITVRILDFLSKSSEFNSRSSRCQVVTTWMGDCLRTGKQPTPRLTQPFISQGKVNEVPSCLPAFPSLSPFLVVGVVVVVVIIMYKLLYLVEICTLTSAF